MGKAVSYTLAQWESLEVYLKEPEIEIDNNLVKHLNVVTQTYDRYSSFESIDYRKVLAVTLTAD
jgi:Transposase IS66 family